MGRIAKLGNFLQDAASFAIPAGAVLGATALTGGAALGAPALLSALGAGAGGLSRNEREERARKFRLLQEAEAEAAAERNKQSVGTANLINVLSPGSGARASIEQPRPVSVPKPGFVENLSGGVQIGVGAFQAAQAAKQAAGVAADQDRLRQLQIAKAEREAAAAQTLGRRQIGADAATAGLKGIPGEITSFKTGETRPGIQPLDEAPLDVRAGFETERVAQELQGLEKNLLAKKLETPAKPRNVKGMADIALNHAIVNPHMSQDEFFALPDLLAIQGVEGLTPAEKASLYSSYNAQSTLRQGELDKVTRVAVNSFNQLLKTDKTIQEKAELTRALLQIYSAIDVGGEGRTQGFADIQLMKMLARLQDPNSVVRQEEFNTLVEGQALFEQMGIKLEGIFTGQKLTDAGRAEILKLAREAYDGRIVAFNGIVTASINSILAQPGLSEGAKNAVNTASQKFLLPPLTSVVGEQRVKRVELRLEKFLGKRAPSFDLPFDPDFDATGATGSTSASSDSTRVGLGAQQRGGGVGTMGGFGFPTQSQMAEQLERTAEQLMKQTESSDPITANLAREQLRDVVYPQIRKLMGRP